MQSVQPEIEPAGLSFKWNLACIFLPSFFTLVSPMEYAECAAGVQAGWAALGLAPAGGAAAAIGQGVACATAAADRAGDASADGAPARAPPSQRRDRARHRSRKVTSAASTERVSQPADGARLACAGCTLRERPQSSRPRPAVQEVPAQSAPGRVARLASAALRIQCRHSVFMGMTIASSFQERRLTHA